MSNIIQQTRLLLRYEFCVFYTNTKGLKLTAKLNNGREQYILVNEQLADGNYR